MYFVSLFFLNARNFTTSLLVMHLKCTAVHYANLNSSSKKKSFLNYRLLNMLFRFFRFHIYVWKNYHFYYKFPKFMSTCSILQNNRMSNLVILKWWHFEYKVNLKIKIKKWRLLFRSKVDFFDVFSKRLCKGSFDYLEINSYSKFHTRATISQKMAALWS